jgi:hypothetical protein
MQKFKESAGLHFISFHYQREKVQFCNIIVTYRSHPQNGNVCNNFLQSIPRMATLHVHVCNKTILRYIHVASSPFAEQYVTICYISSRSYIPCLIIASQVGNAINMLLILE